MNAQPDKMQALNHFISYANESAHGMLVVHRLLETFNQEVNKFVDLDSYKINFYSNNDLPHNIFEDQDHWFYETTPYEWYEQCLIDAKGIFSSYESALTSHINKMLAEINSINQVRFEAENVLQSVDLNNRDNLEKIYTVLEKAVDHFESYYLEQEALRKTIIEIVEKEGLNKDNSDLRRFHNTIRSLLRDLRYKDDDQWGIKLDRIEQLMSNKTWDQAINGKVKLVHGTVRRFFETGQVSKEYKLYGKYYYYHNSRILNDLNRYGNGYVSSFNMDLNKSVKLQLFEVPHFYMVVYPNKWLEDVPLMSTDPSILDIPERIRDREVVMRNKVILVDQDLVEIELYDHQLVDGDIISVSFNGDWIIEEQKLKAKPFKFNLQLNPEGKNYLLLHAENLGEQPPNTMAIRYEFQGKKHTIVLSSDLEESELIEIRRA